MLSRVVALARASGMSRLISTVTTRSGCNSGGGSSNGVVGVAARLWHRQSQHYMPKQHLQQLHLQHHQQQQLLQQSPRYLSAAAVSYQSPLAQQQQQQYQQQTMSPLLRLLSVGRTTTTKASSSMMTFATHSRGFASSSKFSKEDDRRVTRSLGSQDGDDDDDLRFDAMDGEVVEEEETDYNFDEELEMEATNTISEPFRPREPSETDRYNERLCGITRDRSIKNKSEKAAKAVELFREMQLHQVPANVSTYCELLLNLLRADQFDLALSILQEPPVTPASTTTTESSSSSSSDTDLDASEAAAPPADTQDLLNLSGVSPIPRKPVAPYRPVANHYELVIRAYLKRGSIDKAYDVLSTMHNAGVGPTPESFRLLFKKATSHPNLLSLSSFDTTEQHIEALHKELQAHQTAPCSSALNALLVSILCPIESPSDAAFVRAFEVLRYMSLPTTSGSPPNIDTYATLIEACTNTQRVERVRELEFELKSAGLAPDSRIQRSQFRLLASTSSFDAAKDYLESLIRAALPQSMSAFDGNSLSSATAVEMPAAPIFNEYIIGLLKHVEESHSIRLAFQVLSTMRQLGVEPDCETYTILLAGCAGYDDWAQVPRLDLAPPGFPDRSAFNVMLGVAANKGLVDRVRGVMRNMRRNGLRLDVATYNLLVKAHCVSGDLDAAIEAYHSMPMRPNAQTFQFLFGKRNIPIDRACKLWIEMETSGISATATHYARLLRLCCDANNEELAVRFAEQYIRSTTAVYNAKVFAPLEASYPRRFTELITAHRDLVQQRVEATARRPPQRKLFKTLAKPKASSF